MEETLEEAAKNHGQDMIDFPALENPILSFKLGAKWMAERMYSDKEVIDLLSDFKVDIDSVISVGNWFNKNKKK